MKVLIAYDGSPCADAALRDLRRAGLQREVEAVVITVAERWLPAPPLAAARQTLGSASGAAPAIDMADDVKIANQIALEARSRIESYFRDWNVQSVAVAGSPAQEVLKLADKWKPNLIVVGGQGCTCAGGVFQGSVSQKILHEAQCSVRVCKGTAWKNGAPIRIVIALDGSPSSDKAVKAMMRRVWPIWSEVRLVSVIDPGRSRTTGQQPENSPAKINTWIRQFVESTETELRAVGLGVSSRVEEGDPKQIILSNAEEWGADCILLGAASSPVSALGDVATAVAARAHCSAEVIRQPRAVA